MWSANLNSSSTFEGGFLDNSRKEGQEDTKFRRVQTLVPVMVKHLLSDTPIDDKKIWNIPVRMFTIVGIVRNIEETATKMSYDIEDQTGTITALKWLEADKKSSERTMEVNTYVRVVGLLREQNNKRHVLILRMWPLQDLNELTNHILEVTFATLKAEAMANKGKDLGNDKNGTAGNDKPSDDSPYYGMTGDQTLVYKIIHARNDTESGIDRPAIKAQVPKKILREIDNILDFLVSEGHIYTTSTDDHFKTT